MSAGPDKLNAKAVVAAAASLLVALAVPTLAVPSLAAGSPACGVYCPSPAPDPSRTDKPGQSGGGSGGSGGSGGGSESSPSGSGAGSTDGSGTAGTAGSALDRALGLTGDRDGRRDRDRDRDRNGGERNGSGDGAAGSERPTPPASVAGIAAESRGGLGLLFPLLLVITGLWAILAGVRRRRRGSASGAR